MKLKLEQIVEMYEAKTAICNDLILRAVSDRPQKLILLEGPSGVGKTTLVRAIVEHFLDKYPDRFTFKEIGTVDVTEHVTSTAKRIIILFKDIREKNKPVILFVDEADTIFASRLNAGYIREERTSTLMIELNNETTNLYIIAATNRPKRIDRAVLERFAERINCPYPTTEGLKQLLDLHIPFIDEKMKSALNNLILNSVNEGIKWSGRDMELIADKLITHRDVNRLSDSGYQLTIEDVANQYNLRINSKKHLKDDYLEDDDEPKMSNKFKKLKKLDKIVSGTDGKSIQKNKTSDELNAEIMLNNPLSKLETNKKVFKISNK